MNNEELKTLERKLFLQYFEFVLEGGDMVFLKKQTNLTWGNLSVQVKKTGRCRICNHKKRICRKKPHTIISMTDMGRKAFEDYSSQMMKMLKETAFSGILDPIKYMEKNMQKNPVVFWELASHDMEQTVQFFTDVFEWKIEFSDRLGFYVIPELSPPDEPVDGAVFTLKRAKLPFLTVYIKVKDIEEKARLIEEKGGFIVDPPSEIPGGSYICLFNEPSGVTFAMWQPKPSAE